MLREFIGGSRPTQQQSRPIPQPSRPPSPQISSTGATSTGYNYPQPTRPGLETAPLQDTNVLLSPADENSVSVINTISNSISNTITGGPSTGGGGYNYNRPQPSGDPNIDIRTVSSSPNPTVNIPSSSPPTSTGYSYPSPTNLPSSPNPTVNIPSNSPPTSTGYNYPSSSNVPSNSPPTSTGYNYPSPSNVPSTQQTIVNIPSTSSTSTSSGAPSTSYPSPQPSIVSIPSTSTNGGSTSEYEYPQPTGTSFPSPQPSSTAGGGILQPGISPSADSGYNYPQPSSSTGGGALLPGVSPTDAGYNYPAPQPFRSSRDYTPSSTSISEVSSVAPPVRKGKSDEKSSDVVIDIVPSISFDFDTKESRQEYASAVEKGTVDDDVKKSDLDPTFLSGDFDFDVSLLTGKKGKAIVFGSSSPSPFDTGRSTRQGKTLDGERVFYISRTGRKSNRIRNRSSRY